MRRRDTSINADEFFQQAGYQPPPDRAEDYEVRLIGTDPGMVKAIIDRIAIGEKTMTYSLPWIAEKENWDPPAAGRLVFVLDATKQPCMLLRLTRVETLLFGEVTASDIAREGLPMRDLDAWRPLHVDVWNIKLAPFGLEVDDQMPVWAEYFDLLYHHGS